MERLWYLPSVIVLIGVGLGPLGVQLGVLDPVTGWAFFSFGLVFALLSLPITAGAAAFASAMGRSWRGAALRGAIVPLGVVVTLVLPNGYKLLPLIHDITTDPSDSLQFSPEVVDDESQRARESIPREQVLQISREVYPDLEPLELELEPAQAFELALATASEQPGWRVIDSDPATGIIEAEATSRLFEFVDDVIIRVRAADDGGGSRVDMRSRSRVGQSDLRANAERIRGFMRALRERS